jgi:hypothetical protein
MEARAVNRSTYMNYTMLTRSGWLLTGLAALCLSGCAVPHKPLYAWGSYQTQVHAHLKNQSSPEQQILDIEKDLALAAAQGAAVPPGTYAHLGLMYLNTGKHEQAGQAWTREKELFPESGAFIDYLLKNMKKQGS